MRVPAVILVSLLALSAAARAPISVAFPAERQRLPGVAETYFIGAVESVTGAVLTVNGATVDVYRTGAFLAMVPAVPGPNTVTVRYGGESLVRTFLVTASVPPPACPPEPIVSADDARLAPPDRAWRAAGELFKNRVRAQPCDGDTLGFLPPGYVVAGMPVRKTGQVAVWFGGRLGFVESSVLRPAPEVPVPSRTNAAPDIAAGFSPVPPAGRAPGSVRILVDPGHGGSDTGAISPHGRKEKDANLMQALAIRDALLAAGFEVRMTRDDDSFPALYDRPQLAYDWHADAFISVHHNATAPQTNPREHRYTGAFASTAPGLVLASNIQTRVAAVLPDVRNMGARLASYAVCRNPAVPSCLLEFDFINLPEGEEAIFDYARERRIADAVVAGVKDWMAAPSAR